jgi:hypothetical protein
MPFQQEEEEHCKRLSRAKKPSPGVQSFPSLSSLPNSFLHGTIGEKEWIILISVGQMYWVIKNPVMKNPLIISLTNEGEVDLQANSSHISFWITMGLRGDVMD